jgi:hypothetical protein
MFLFFVLGQRRTKITSTAFNLKLIGSWSSHWIGNFPAIRLSVYDGTSSAGAVCTVLNDGADGADFGLVMPAISAARMAAASNSQRPPCLLAGSVPAAMQRRMVFFERRNVTATSANVKRTGNVSSEAAGESCWINRHRARFRNEHRRTPLHARSRAADRPGSRARTRSDAGNGPVTGAGAGRRGLAWSPPTHPPAASCSSARRSWSRSVLLPAWRPHERGFYELVSAEDLARQNNQ